MKKKVLLGMSGGLDSTYAVHVLRECGFEVEGAVLRMHPYTEVAEAEAAARSLSVPLRVIDAMALFEECVISDFCADYHNAQTPNPCVVCNEKVKFRLLYEEAKREGFDAIATGHYANVVYKDGRYAVSSGEDARKDQSYMLYRLPQEILAMLVLPLGDCIKSEIVKSARAMDMAAAERPESQEICFVKDESYADFIERRTHKSLKGFFVDEDGKILGEHEGMIRYTVGQRKGLGISAASRLFVQELRTGRNEIVLAPQPRKNSNFYVKDAVFSGMKRELLEEGAVFDVKIRYNAPKVKVKVAKENGELHVVFLDGGHNVTPGQSAVFYREDVVMFGGKISLKP